MAPVKVCVIGTGFAGLCMAIQLKRAGIENFVVLDKAAKVGGTWRENTYPGAGCDVPCHLYSFSFELNPNWSRRFAKQPEIIDYIESDSEIGVLVLGAGTDRKGPGPLVTQMSKSAGSLPVPITIVPGDLSKEKLEAIT